MNKVSLLYHTFKIQHCMSAQSAFKLGAPELAKTFINIKHERDSSKIDRIKKTTIPFICREQYVDDLIEKHHKISKLKHGMRCRDRLLLTIYNQELSEQQLGNKNSQSGKSVRFNL